MANLEPITITKSINNTKTIDIDVVIDNASEITVELEQPTPYATKEELKAAYKEQLKAEKVAAAKEKKENAAAAKKALKENQAKILKAIQDSGKTPEEILELIKQ